MPKADESDSPDTATDQTHPTERGIHPSPNWFPLAQILLAQILLVQRPRDLSLAYVYQGANRRTKPTPTKPDLFLLYSSVPDWLPPDEYQSSEPHTGGF